MADNVVEVFAHPSARDVVHAVRHVLLRRSSMAVSIVAGVIVPPILAGLFVAMSPQGHLPGNFPWFVFVLGPAWSLLLWFGAPRLSLRNPAVARDDRQRSAIPFRARGGRGEGRARAITAGVARFHSRRAHPRDLAATQVWRPTRAYHSPTRFRFSRTGGDLPSSPPNEARQRCASLRAVTSRLRW